MRFNKEKKWAYKRQKIRDLDEYGDGSRLFWISEKRMACQIKHKLQGIDNDYDYGEVYSRVKALKQEPEQQRQERLLTTCRNSSIVIPFKTPNAI